MPALLVVALAPAPAVGQKLPEERIARIEQGLLPAVRVKGRSYAPSSLAERMRQHQVPAISIAVVNDGRIEWAKAYGLADVESGRTATTATLFQAASISKPVAVTAALQLVQEGKLSLDEDVNLKLRSWKVPANGFTAKKPVTLRRIVSHTAGLTVHGFPGYAASASLPTVVQVLNGEAPANTRPVRVDVEPGTIWRYAGGGTTVMQLLLTEVTGQPFPQLMRERVLDRIGMTASTYEQPLPAARAVQAATGYRTGSKPIAGHFHTYPEMAAAGLWTTPTDLAKWMIEVQRAFSGASEKMISRRTAELMLTPVLGGGGLGPTLWASGDTLRFGHGGANEGFRAQVMGFAHRGQGAVIMTNSDTGGPLIQEVLTAIFQEYGWSGYGPREIVPIALDAEALREYVGRYSSGEPPQTVTIELRDGALWCVASAITLELVPTGKDEFFALGAGPVRFERGAEGKTGTLVLGGTRLSRTH
ncbi:MAG TPA: serine hydrolase [Longimicrobiales bacterium]|nr:serine hydrolase [Longimicrobiales bacterium]